MSLSGEVQVVTVTSHIWDARVKLRAEDIGLRPEDLPAQAVAGLGSKYTYDRKVLRVLTSKRGHLQRMLRAIGVNLGGAFVVPAETYENARSKLEKVVADFYHELGKIKAEVSSTYPAWKQSIPEQFRTHLQEGDIDQELSRCSLRINAFHVLEVHAHETSRIEERLVEEVAADAAEMLRGSFGRQANRTEGTQRVLNPLHRLRDKVRSMASLVSPDIWHPIVDAMDDLLSSLPKTGPLDAVHMRRLYSFLIALSGVESARVREALTGWGAEQSRSLSSGSKDGFFSEAESAAPEPAAPEPEPSTENAWLAELAEAWD